MRTPRNAAIYARISSDDGTALGVRRQVEDCRKLAAELGWDVAEEYVDNDISATYGKRRPAYEAMLADINDGVRDGVLVYHPDRLTRRPIELERFVEIVTAAKVRQVRFVAGAPVDVGTGDGLLVLRMLAAVAANESASKSRRVRRKMEEVAAEGRPHGGSRPFGYERDKVTVRPDEAEIVRQLVARFLAGESLRSLATWLEEEEVVTVFGGPWRTSTLHDLLVAPRIAGLREHNGEVVGAAVWPAIIGPEDRKRVLAQFETKKLSGRRAPRRYLLSGLLRCGKCGGKLFSAARKTTRRYVCMSGPDHNGCGQLTVVAGPLEELLTDAVLYRLDTPELAATLTGRDAADTITAALADSLAADEAKFEELAAMWAANEISRPEWLKARAPIAARIEDARKRLARLTRNDALAGLAGNGEQLRGQWAGLNLTRQSAIVGAVIDHAVIHAGQRGARTLDPQRAEIIWRV